MTVIAVIPARYAASRFPGKPLVSLAGKPMVQHVFERCVEAACFDRICVATDDERIKTAVEGFGGEAVMTSPACPSGTDRVAEVARAWSGAPDDVFINVQGDEPAVSPFSLQALSRVFADSHVHMATLVRPLRDEERLNANVVKAVRDEAGFALYFSRSELPYPRDPAVPVERWAHLGLYGYRRATLFTLAALKPTALEKTEGLEQLRALGHGIRILCAVTPHASQAVDVPDDVPKAEAALRALKP